MSLLLTGAILGGGILVGRLIARAVLRHKSRAASSDEAPHEDEDETNASQARAPMTEVSGRDPFASLPCRIGDVILGAGGEEAWLAGALVFSEDAVVAVLFVAPEAKRDRAVLARAGAGGRLLWLEPLAAGEVATGAEPPTSIEHEGTRFERLRRLPVRVERVGSGAPDLGDRAIVAEYATPAGDALLLAVGAAAATGACAWRGIAIEEGTYDVLPGDRNR